jgi:hypothetical protein
VELSTIITRWATLPPHPQGTWRDFYPSLTAPPKVTVGHEMSATATIPAEIQLLTAA